MSMLPPSSPQDYPGFMQRPPPPLPPVMSIPFFESCITKACMSGIGGGVFGGLFGLIFGANMGVTPPELQDAPVKKQIIEGFRMAKRSAWSSAKSFGKIGFMFAGFECGLETIRARGDTYNSVMAGFLTGAILSYRGGPKAMALGATGFAAFSVVFDYILGRYDPSTKAIHEDKFQPLFTQY